MAMPVSMILVVYDILCILSYDFNKLTMLYIHVHISSSMTNKSGLTFFLSIKYLSVCLTGEVLEVCVGVIQIRNAEYYSCLNPFKPDFTIVIFIHYKPRIAVAIS